MHCVNDQHDSECREQYRDDLSDTRLSSALAFNLIAVVYVLGSL